MKGRKEEFVFFIILLLVLSFLYIRTFSYEYIWDSKIQIANNKLLKENASPLKAFEYGYWEGAGYNKGANDYYRPLMIASLIINKIILGNSPYSYRIINLFIFYLSLIVLFYFLKRFKDDEYFPEITVLLFSLFPLHVDNIVWIVGRCDLLMLLWGFLSLLYFDKYLEKKWKKDFALSLVFYTLGLFSKESFLFFFPFIILFEIFRKRRINILNQIFYAMLTLLFFIVKFSVNGAGGVRFLLFKPFIKNLYILLGSIGYYFKSMIIPVDFIMFVSAKTILKTSYYIWGILFIVLYFFLFILAIKKEELRIPLLFTGVFFPLYLVFVFSNLFPYSLSTRYIIIPFFGFLWIFVLFLLRLKDVYRKIILILMISIYSFSIIINSASYKSELFFWRKMVKNQPDVAFVNAEYARALILKGDYLQAEKYLKKTLNLRMKEYTAILTGILFSNISVKKAEYGEAINWLKRIENLRLDLPSQRDVYTIKIRIAKYRGKFKRAEELIMEAQRKLPFKAVFSKELLNLYLCFDKLEKARKFYFKGREKIKDLYLMERLIKNSQKNKSVQYYVKCGNFRRAIEILNKKPVSEMSIKELFSLAELYYRVEEPINGDKLIEEIFKRGKNNPLILNAIGYFYLNKFLKTSKAIIYFRKSLTLDVNQQNLKKIIKSIKEYN